MSMQVKRICAAFLASIVFISTASAGPFSELVIFGDSLSDRGNTLSVTFGTAPAGPGYSGGRFSNGPVWVEQLSTLLNLGPVVRSKSGGKDFAFGGVTTGAGETIYNPGAAFEVKGSNIGKQVTDWTAAHNANKTQLFTMLGGANDFFNVIDKGAAHTAQGVADNIKTNLSNLYADGARNFMVLNLPDLGQTPSYRTDATKSPQATKLAKDFNDALTIHLDKLKTDHADINIYRLDLFKLVSDAIAKPADFGFTNVADRAYTGDDKYEGNGTVVNNSTKYLFWDAVHPTAYTHKLIGDKAWEAIPEPSSLALLVAGALCCGGRVRRR